MDGVCPGRQRGDGPALVGSVVMALPRCRCVPYHAQVQVQVRALP